jgi:Sulfotransferase family
MLRRSTLTRAGLFFAVGPLRTGSSLLARCIDDHPAAICLCESEINRALFKDYYLELHCERMVSHGFTLQEAIRFVDRKKRDDIPTWLAWYSQVAARLSVLYDKLYLPAFGEKSPDFFVSPELVSYLAANFPLIYTVRDPRAILRSIVIQDDASPQLKAERWDALVQNYVAWKPFLDDPNLLVVRYEDMITDPIEAMSRVYEHLNLARSLRFLEPFPRRFPQRFLWDTSVARESGVKRDFDTSRINLWKATLTAEQLDLVYSNPTIVEFLHRFGYDGPDRQGTSGTKASSAEVIAGVSSLVSSTCGAGGD